MGFYWSETDWLDFPSTGVRRNLGDALPDIFFQSIKGQTTCHLHLKIFFIKQGPDTWVAQELWAFLA
jgi:hypothetical protein